MSEENTITETSVQANSAVTEQTTPAVAGTEAAPSFNTSLNPDLLSRIQANHGSLEEYINSQDEAMKARNVPDSYQDYDLPIPEGATPEMKAVIEAAKQDFHKMKIPKNLAPDLWKQNLDNAAQLQQVRETQAKNAAAEREKKINDLSCSKFGADIVRGQEIISNLQKQYPDIKPDDLVSIAHEIYSGDKKRVAEGIVNHYNTGTPYANPHEELKKARANPAIHDMRHPEHGEARRRLAQFEKAALAADLKKHGIKA